MARDSSTRGAAVSGHEAGSLTDSTMRHAGARPRQLATMRGSCSPPDAIPDLAMPPKLQSFGTRASIVAFACVVVAGCASTPRQGAPGDPLEPLNRRIHAFNDVFDRNVARPVARGYRTVTPDLVERGIGNFFSNLDDVTVLANSVLQLKGRKSARTTARLFFNTTIGLAGVLDVAGTVGIPKGNEDFGQTLGHWGLGPGPYLVIPLLGPSDLRDGSGRFVDAQYDVLDEITDDDAEYYGAYLLGAIDARARLLSASDVLDTAALDPYAFTREAYLRRRANLVHDGDPPPQALPGDAGEGGEAFDPFSDEDDDLFDEGDDGGGDPTGQ